MQNTIKKLENLFEIKNHIPKHDSLHFITIDKEHLVMLLTHLRDVEGFTHLSFMTVVDMIEDGIFKLIYMLHNYKLKADLGVYVEIDRENPVMDSIHHLWKQARTYQQELHEMFGMDYPGSPGVYEEFILESWGDNPPPMRREFDTKKYSEETYFPRPGRSTNDPRKYMKEKLYPEDDSV
ncbi:MAG: NADH-quinone oxidoreductase subunit C [Candidatus Zixiibacteriota bacterium]